MNNPFAEIYKPHFYFRFEFIRFVWNKNKPFCIMTESQLLILVNQIFEIEKKLAHHGFEKVDRNIDRLKGIIAEAGISFHNPTGEKYNETRTDCSATLLEDGNDLVIHETVKPIVYRKNDADQEIIQQARVIVKQRG
jgi:hypothetical protein